MPKLNSNFGCALLWKPLNTTTMLKLSKAQLYEKAHAKS